MQDNDDEEDYLQEPVVSTRSNIEPMIVDQTGTDTTNVPPSGSCMTLVTASQRSVYESDPLFDIDDAYMESDEDEVKPNLAIVEIESDPVFRSPQSGEHIAPIALPPSQNSQTLVPVQTSNAIIPQTNEEKWNLLRSAIVSNMNNRMQPSKLHRRIKMIKVTLVQDVA
ncbi:uncharacterized protein PHALS_13266 [Plasmopara halstedii]|uniref:Uncharacterized protein n=1 Tax=Plasmopara halstedii TaxID=4781 RepID=A0A0P1ANM8_PLAHL|nr:uncharacterized protein PHALS_13266 [Plasmopara halstedii]CEG43041.1 hypothetical protein PHALS_13266 [Plasmopara halstedii]|eukprot:XP_024579410.1 hypothetical protein PHALS_13266 [Plasmopara halstedii]